MKEPNEPWISPRAAAELSAVSEKYQRLAHYEAFDRLVDYALDGRCTLDEAITAFKEEELGNVQQKTS